MVDKKVKRQKQEPFDDDSKPEREGIRADYKIEHVIGR
jgi:hypothetical protein